MMLTGAGMGFGPMSDPAAQRLLSRASTAAATGSIAPLITKVSPERFAQIIAESTNPAVNPAAAGAVTWQQTGAAPLSFGQRLALMPTSTKLGIGLGALALVGVVILRRRAA